jgi:hypothetical protein
MFYFFVTEKMVIKTIFTTLVALYHPYPPSKMDRIVETTVLEEEIQKQLLYYMFIKLLT